ncbi:MAG: hypothetical protein QXJ44_05440 [Candidatus Nitrosocaldus sp.]
MSYAIAIIVGIAIILTSLLAFISITYKSIGITLSDLYKVDASASVAVLDRLGGDEQCLIREAEGLINISKALRDEIMNVRYWADTAGMYNEYSGVTISNDEAYELIRAMVKQATLAIADKPQIDMLYKMRDEHGYISCIIEYDGRYYHISINPFAFILNDGYGYGYNSIPEDQGYVTVRIAYKEFGDARFKIVALDSNKHEVLAPFNNILLFINELDSKLTIYAYAEEHLMEDLSYKHASVTIIPPKGSKPVIFPGLMESKYLYTVKPYNMEGIVNVRSYHSCMSADEARHGYALANFDLKLPSYLPDWYEYKCALHIMNNYVMIYYSKGVSAGPATSMQEALAKGVLVVTAYRVLLSEGYWNAYIDVNNADAIMFDIDGKQGIAYKGVDVDYDILEKYYYNILDLYDDESRVIYSFKSRYLSVDDLVDIARSLR